MVIDSSGKHNRNGVFNHEFCIGLFVEM